MVQVGQDGQSLRDNLMGFFPLDIGNKPDTAGVMLKLWIIQPLLLGYTDCFHSATFCKNGLAAESRNNCASSMSKNQTKINTPGTAATALNICK